MIRILLTIGLVVSWLGVPTGFAQDVEIETNLADEKKPDAKVKSAKIASLLLRGSFAESPGGPGLLGELQPNLSRMIERLESVATDKDIAAVVLRIRGPQLGRGKLNELREAIRKTRRSGKRIYAQLQTASSADYLLALACDQIVMPESGVLMIPGVRTEMLFYRDLLEKLGIEADMLQMGDFKGAAEPYTRSKMSDSFRKQYELVVDDIYDQTIDQIATDRRMDRARVKELIDVGMHTAKDAFDAGLIDQVVFEDGLFDTLKKELNVEELAVMEKYGRQKVDTNFSGMGGFVKFMELFSGSKSSRRSGSTRKIAIVFADGTIMPGESQTGLMGSTSVGSDTITRALHKAAQDKSVAAIVLRVDSPGGSAAASDQIWRKVTKIEKPVVASMGDVAASGGYYIAMGCDSIFAEPLTITGSIGVVGGKLAMKGLYEKVGLTVNVVSRGENSGLLSGVEIFSDSQRKVWLRMMEDIYQQFLSKAATGRKMDVEKLKGLAGGRIWTGRQAKENGLVDRIGTLEDAIAEARKLAGVKENEKTEKMNLPRTRSFIEQMLESGTVEAPSDFNAMVPEDIKLYLGQIATIRALFADPVLLWMPYQLTIR